tara:strand:- start:155 stop:523 length:369 start_codon:yes stop_codon:yes gene_type:complete
MNKFLLIVFLFPLISFQKSNSSKIQIQGEFQKWYKITLLINSPITAEFDQNNPFLNYTLEVVFSNGNRTYAVPGFYATDGNSEETSVQIREIFGRCILDRMKLTKNSIPYEIMLYGVHYSLE